MIQGFVESAIWDYQALLIQQQKEVVEAAQREEEHQRLLTEEEARKKREEEERKAKVEEEEVRIKREKEESEAREQLGLVEKIKEMAEQDPTFLAFSSLQVSAPCTTYLAIDGSKCKKCMSCNVVHWSHWEDLHRVCQVALCMLQQEHPFETTFYYFLFLLNVLPACKDMSDKPDTTNLKHPKPSKCPRPHCTRQSPTRSTTSSSAAKQKVKFDEDDATGIQHCHARLKEGKCLG